MHAQKYGAKPTHPGAEPLIGELAEQLDEKARQWAEIADRCWREGDFMGLYPYPPAEEPELYKPAAAGAARAG